jgi:hypothetical protein
MSRADTRHNYQRKHGMVQQGDIIADGIPPRAYIDAMLMYPRGTDVPLHWIRELSKARDMLDDTEDLPAGSKRLGALVDSAADIEDRAILAFLN